MSVNILKIVETLKPKLIDEMVKKRDSGQSFDVVAVWMTNEIGHSIGRESIRTWFKAFDEKTGATPAKVVRAPNKPKEDELDGTGFVHDPPEEDEEPEWHKHRHEYTDRGNGTKKCSCGDVVSV